MCIRDRRWVEWTGVQADRKAPDSASQEAAVKEFLDLAAPSVLRFETDRFICGNTYPVSYTHLDVYKRQVEIPVQEDARALTLADLACTLLSILFAILVWLRGKKDGGEEMCIRDSPAHGAQPEHRVQRCGTGAFRHQGDVQGELGGGRG